jgi:hypothetical protein
MCDRYLCGLAGGDEPHRDADAGPEGPPLHVAAL